MLSVVKCAWPAAGRGRICIAKKYFCRFIGPKIFERLAKRLFGFRHLRNWTLGVLPAAPDFQADQ
jgi:hypothetical protein